MSDKEKKQLMALGVLLLVGLIVWIPKFIHHGGSDLETPEGVSMEEDDSMSEEEYADSEMEEGEEEEEEYDEFGDEEMGGGGAAAAAVVTPAAAGEAVGPLLTSRVDPFAPVGASAEVGIPRPLPPMPNPGVESLGNLPPTAQYAERPRGIVRDMESALPGTDMLKAPDKRVSGVLVDGAVFAILETHTGSSEAASYVVKPGDVVDGVQVDTVRKNAEDQFVMVITDRENKQREVELRPAPKVESGEGEEGMEGEYEEGMEEEYDEGAEEEMEYENAMRRRMSGRRRTR